jgi:hypothetical protein
VFARREQQLGESRVLGMQRADVEPRAAHREIERAEAGHRERVLAAQLGGERGAQLQPGHRLGGERAGQFADPAHGRRLDSELHRRRPGERHGHAGPLRTPRDRQ